jgi:hypothetical protein
MAGRKPQRGQRGKCMLLAANGLLYLLLNAGSGRPEATAARPPAHAGW